MHKPLSPHRVSVLSLCPAKKHSVVAGWRGRDGGRFRAQRRGNPALPAEPQTEKVKKVAGQQ